MEKEFVPYELAVKLKELGFNEKCFMAYYKLLRHEFYDFRSASNIIFNEDNPIKLLNYAGGDFRVKECDAPLWQQAFEFILTKVDLNIDSHNHYVLSFDGEFNIDRFERIDYEGCYVEDYHVEDYHIKGNVKSLEKLIELV